MAGTRWTVGVAKEITADLKRTLDWPVRGSGINAIGFGLRGTDRRPHVIVTRRHGVEPSKPGAFPSTFKGFDVCEEESEAWSASAWGNRMHYWIDKARRAVGGKPNRCWPGWPGSLVRADGLHKAGSLGCFVRQRQDPTNRFALTCAHVLSASNSKPQNGVPVQSRIPEKTPPGIPVGHVETCSCVEGVQDHLDCALIRLPSTMRGVNVIPKIGRIAKDIKALDDLELGTKVCKFGATSGYTVGTISAVQNISRQLEDPVAGSASGHEEIEGVTEVTPDVHSGSLSFCSRGDSGSIVTLFLSNYRGHVPAVGLLIARGTLLERGYMVGLDRVFECLDIEMA